MGWFSPNPMTLSEGESVHQMVARALIGGAVKVSADITSTVRYHFVGEHGQEYRDDERCWGGELFETVARVCERVQSDYNEHLAGRRAAQRYAVEKGDIVPVFKTLTARSAPPSPRKK